LEVTQLAAHIAIDHLKGNLEYCLRVGDGPWKQIYECLGTLDHLEDAIKTADWRRGWKTNPVVVVQHLIRQVRGFQMPVLDPYLMASSLLYNNLKALWEHSVSYMSAQDLPLPWEVQESPRGSRARLEMQEFPTGFRTRMLEKLLSIKAFLLRRRKREQESQDEIHELTSRGWTFR
jgi:hypothetical protein